eukprot:scaffold11_cov257-Pinguiococcus_pyrenoidosus.AAC.33
MLVGGWWPHHTTVYYSEFHLVHHRQRHSGSFIGPIATRPTNVGTIGHPNGRNPMGAKPNQGNRLTPPNGCLSDGSPLRPHHGRLRRTKTWRSFAHSPATSHPADLRKGFWVQRASQRTPGPAAQRVRSLTHFSKACKSAEFGGRCESRGLRSRRLGSRKRRLRFLGPSEAFASVLCFQRHQERAAPRVLGTGVLRFGPFCGWGGLSSALCGLQNDDQRGLSEQSSTLRSSCFGRAASAWRGAPLSRGTKLVERLKPALS